MVKIIDLSKVFDKHISEYVYKNINKVKAEEIENKIPELYEQFGNTVLAELDGKTPNTYYKQFSTKELLECLKTHLDKGVEVPDFLCEAIVDKKDCEKEIAKTLLGDLEEEYTMYLLNMISEKDCSYSLSRLIEYITLDYAEPIKELSTEILNNYADKVKEKVLEEYGTAGVEQRSYLTEILSHCDKDDRVFDILVKEFAENKDNIPLYSAYLGRYGDERALPYLKSAVQGEKINYQDYEELRFNIELLGGECEERDFCKDKIYKLIKSENKNSENNN